MSAVTAPMPSSTEPVGERVRRLGIRALLLTPAFVWVIVLIILPNLFMIFYSLWENSLGDVSRVGASRTTRVRSTPTSSRSP